MPSLTSACLTLARSANEYPMYTSSLKKHITHTPLQFNSVCQPFKIYITIFCDFLRQHFFTGHPGTPIFQINHTVILKGANKIYSGLSLSYHFIPKKKRGLIASIFFMVRMRGLEPPRLAAPDPKSGASANSATSANSIVIR